MRLPSRFGLQLFTFTCSFSPRGHLPFLTLLNLGLFLFCDAQESPGFLHHHFRQVFGNVSGSKCLLTRCNPLLSIHAEFKKVSGIDTAKRVLVTLLKSVAGICGLVVFLTIESSDFQADPPCQNCLIHFAQK